MIISIVGPPHAGKKTLGHAVATAQGLAVVDFDSIRLAISRRASSSARRASALVESGRLVPDDLLGRLIRECVADRDAVVVGRPRTEEEMRGMETLGGAFTHYLVHLDATPELLDARRAAHGLPPMEQAHPGAFARLAVALAPVVATTAAKGRMLRLDPSRPPDELLSAVLSFLRGLGAPPES